MKSEGLHLICKEGESHKASWEGLFSNCRHLSRNLVFTISVCSVILIPWWRMWHSHPCFIFFLVTSCSSLVCPPRGSLPLKQPFKLTSLVGVHHNSHPLPLFAPSVLLPAAVLSRLSSLHIFAWANFFHSCHPLLSLTVLFTHVLRWSSLFSLLVAVLGSCPSSCLPQHWPLRLPITFVVPHGPLLHCQVHIPQQTFPCKLMQFSNKLAQALVKLSCPFWYLIP